MIEAWFPTLIYFDDLPHFKENNKAYVEKALECQRLYPKVQTNWKCTTYNTMYLVDLTKDPLLLPLITECKKHVKMFAGSLNAEYTEIECTAIWFNIAGHKDAQEFHTHSENHFSLVYYVTAPENCGRIAFKAADNMYPIKARERNFSNSESCFYQPTESKIVMFTSNTPHMVEPNMSDENRISIAMNFKLI